MSAYDGGDIARRGKEMSILLDFYACDITKIVEALRVPDFQILKNPTVVSRHADFSFHLNPEDINSLFEVIGFITDEKNEPLSDVLTPLTDVHSLADILAAENFEPGPIIQRVNPNLVEKIAVFPYQKTEELAKQWFKTLGRKYNDGSLAVTPGIIIAIQDLLNLCRFAKDNGKDVAFVTTL
jgi:hypothetical protein